MCEPLEFPKSFSQRTFLALSVLSKNKSEEFEKLPVTTLLRAIGYETDKQILEIFNLADEVKVSKSGLKKVVGRKLAARVLKTWIEDFVDEDTGEVVSIERNEVIIDRETVIEKELEIKLEA